MPCCPAARVAARIPPNKRVEEKRGANVNKIVHLLKLFLGMFYKLLFRYSELVLLVIVVLVTTQVILRKFFSSSLVWSEEVSLLLVVWMAFIAMAIGVAENLHISISLFFDKFPKFMQGWLIRINHVLVAIVGIIFIYYGSILAYYTRNSTLPTTKWPSLILYLMIPVSGIYILYFSITKLYRNLANRSEAEKGEIEI